MLRAEQAVAMAGETSYLDRADYASLSATPFRNSPEADAAREAALRQAQIASDAREAGVFFRLAKSGDTNPKPLAEAVPNLPFDMGLGPKQIPFGAEHENDPGRQIRKLEFLKEGEGSSTDNPYRLEDPITPFEVMAGTVIPASLITGVNSGKTFMTASPGTMC